MSVSKRVRYEVMRRDNYACRYCGATAESGATLVIDHVVPESLGGASEPGNLATACRDCNSGKAASTPDEPVVDDVRQAALRYAAAVRRAAADLEAAQAPMRDYVGAFDDEWRSFTHGLGPRDAIPRPADWPRSIEGFFLAGLPIEALIDALHRSMSTTRVSHNAVFRYMCGICWSRVREIQARALEILDEEDGSSS